MSKSEIAALRKWLASETRLSKIWMEGFCAAKSGASEDINPYANMSDGLLWLDGWSLYRDHPAVLNP